MSVVQLQPKFQASTLRPKATSLNTPPRFSGKPSESPETGSTRFSPSPALLGSYAGVKFSGRVPGGFREVYVGNPVMVPQDSLRSYLEAEASGRPPAKTSLDITFDKAYMAYQGLTADDEPGENAAKPARGKVADLQRILLRNGVVNIDGPVTDAMLMMVKEKVNILVSIMKKTGKAQPIKFLVNSPGGSVLAMNGILDAMDMAKNTEINGEKIPVATYCQGYAASAASLIMANGTKGHRHITPRSEIMIHQPLGGASGQASDIEINNNLIQKMKRQMVEFFGRTTNLSEDEVARRIDRDWWMDAAASKEGGFVDHIVEQFPDLQLEEKEATAMVGLEPKKDEPGKK